MDKTPLNRLADKAVDSAICAWMSLGVGIVLGLSYSWLLYPPLLGISLLCGWRFIHTMLAINLALDNQQEGV